MLKFLTYHDGQKIERIGLDGAYLIGTDYVPIRSEFETRDDELTCQKRTQGPAALAVLWPVKGVGKVMLETTRLTERDRPYNLALELARGQMMRVSHKREDWGLFGIDNIEPILRQIKLAQELFIEAIKASNLAKASKLADDVLATAVPLGERMALFHASVFLNRRRTIGQIGKHHFGCTINPQYKSDLYCRRLKNGFDFVNICIPWREIEPKQGELHWDPIDEWVDWAVAQGMPIKASPLVSFNESCVPDWLYIYEHDYDTVRDLVYEHIRRVVQRYKDRIGVWDAISGLHAYNTFNFNFEQLMELTRMSTAITKQLAPRAITLVEIVMPWGEYYAHNQRSIPPLLFTEMLVQNNVNFDAFGVQFLMGMNLDGMYVRDMFQLSSMLDRFATIGKPVHITAVQVPSRNVPDEQDAWGGAYTPADAGLWHDEWSEKMQSRWLREFYNVALSKPFIDTITWRDLADKSEHHLPHGGLLRHDLNPKLAYEQLCTIRAQLYGTG